MALKGELASLKKRRRSVRPEELHALLTEAGFVRPFGKGDHWVYAPAPSLPVEPSTREARCYLPTCLRPFERSRVLADESNEADENA
jgi:hypothetical protein